MVQKPHKTIHTTEAAAKCAYLSDRPMAHEDERERERERESERERERERERKRALRERTPTLCLDKSANCIRKYEMFTIAAFQTFLVPLSSCFFRRSKPWRSRRLL